MHADRYEELERLRGVWEQRGVISDHEIMVSADRLGCSTGHVRRLLVEVLGRRRQPRWEVEEWLLPLLYAHGNITALHDDLIAARQELVDAGDRVPVELERVPAEYASFRRAFKRLPASLVDFPRTGTNGLRRRMLHLTWNAEHRNQVWQADSCNLDIWIVPSRCRTPVRPWLVAFLDDRHRMVVGAALCVDTPTGDATAATAAAAMQVRPFEVADGVFGGRPERILVDNGPEWRGKSFTTFMAAVGTAATPTLRYTPTQKGKIERWFGTFQRWVLASLPGYSKGPKSWSGTQLFKGDLSDLLDEHELWRHISERIVFYNEHRVHRALGMSPAESWLTDANPLLEVEPAAVRLAVVRHPTMRVAHRDGIHFRQRVYLATAASYDDWIEERVRVGYLPHDDRQVELFTPQGQWIATATRSDLVDDVDKLRVVARRFDAYEYVRDMAIEARDLRHERSRHATDDGVMPSLTTLLIRRTGTDAAVTTTPVVPDAGFLDATAPTPEPTKGPEQLSLFSLPPRQVRRR